MLPNIHDKLLGSDEDGVEGGPKGGGYFILAMVTIPKLATDLTKSEPTTASLGCKIPERSQHLCDRFNQV